MLSPQSLVAQAKEVITEIDQATALQRINAQEAMVLDVREPDEYHQGHLLHATNVPRGVLEFKIGEVAANTSASIVVYCRTGGRAALAAKSLQELGYENVSSIAGGYEAWVDASLPTITPSTTNYY